MEIPKNHQTVLEFAEQGSIINGILAMPTLWSLDKKGHYRYWNLYIGIFNDKKQLDVNQNYINRELLPKGYYGAYWTESGVEDTVNPIISEKTPVKTGKNVKNKNFTTPFTQAILDSRSDFNLKIRKGSVLDKENLNAHGDIISLENLMKQSHRGEAPWRVFAMAVHDVNKNKNWRHITFPCKIQPKLDGTMFLVVCHPDLPEMDVKTHDNKIVKLNIDCYSRGRKSFKQQDHILLELFPILKNYPGLHLVGELWKEGYGLQEISGLSRRQLDTTIAHIKLNFNIFDCFYLDQQFTFEERDATVDDIMSELKEPVYIKQVPSYEVENKETLMSKYQIFLEENMEGAIIRNLNSLYEFGLDKEQRSYQTLKLKPSFDGEWPLVGFKDGTGKEIGAVIWICAETEEDVMKRTGEKITLDERKKFSVTPNLPYEIRYKIYENLKTTKLFEKIKGQLLTIKYSILSKDLLPQQPKMLRFRDPAINEQVLDF